MQENVIIINGKRIKFTGNIVVKVKKDVYDEKDKKTDIEKPSRMIIEINGNIGNLVCDEANIIVNGNVGKALTANGNIKCNSIKGKAVAITIESETIHGYVQTSGDVITETFNGNTNVGRDKLFEFVPIKKSQLKKGVVIFHKKHGRGIIKDYWCYNYKNSSGSISVDFDNEGYPKTLQVDSILTNKSVSLISETNKCIREECKSEMYYDGY
jgi:uncharacterized protein YdeI (BOF family)